jgi:streptogramin lyase
VIDPNPTRLPRATEAFLRPFRPLALACAILLAGCDGDGVLFTPPEQGVEVGVVVNSVELSLTVFPLEDPGASWTIPLGPDGSPTGAAVRDNLAVVPMGIVPVAVVVDLAAGAVLRSAALPSGSGSTGAAFVNDSIVLVANPDRNSVSPVNVLRGTVAAEIPVGRFPMAVTVEGDRIWVVNGELENFSPDGPGTLTILDRETLEVTGTVTLSGENPGGIALGPDGLLWVVHGGVWGADNGSVSVVDPALAEEVAHHTGFGAFPQGPALAGDGRLYVSSWSFGLAAWDPSTEAFHRSPDDPIAPEGVAASAGVSVDPEGNVWSLFPECSEPSRVLRLGPTYSTELFVDVGICPAALYFVELQGVDGG